MSKQLQLVVVRHGHSLWNLCNRFTGWNDIPLTEVGLQEAADAGSILTKHQFQFDEAHISVLQRTRQTLNSLLSASQHRPIPIYRSWRLNERHYGQLQDMYKADIFSQWGEQQAKRWWRGYHERPPALDYNDPRHPRFDELYHHIHEPLPACESLGDCQRRLLPYWHDTIAPRIKSGRRMIIISHGNTMRALHMHIAMLNEQQIETFEIPSAVPLVYNFDNKLNLLKYQWLEQPPT